MPRQRRLDRYEAKRDFTVTAEPGPAPAVPRDGPLVFMVHKHAARQLHYDLRLELDGVLLSWAVPKGPSTNPKERRFAAHVEDHPFEYGCFEGVIAAGGYGAGPSLVWDAGTYSPDERGHRYWLDREQAQQELRDGLAAGKISVTFRGRKLKGSWALVRTDDTKDAWLLLKHRDVAARSDVDFLADGRSVISGLTIEELRGGESGRAAFAEEPYAVPALLPGAKPGSAGFVAPMLATAAPLPSNHPGWSFEPKLDGIRAMALIEGGVVHLRSRGGHDITHQYPGIAADLSLQPVQSALFDGEIVAVGPGGRPSFELLQRRMNLQDAGQVAEADQSIPTIFYAFDLIHADGSDLTATPLHLRREALARLLLPTSRVAAVPVIDLPFENAFGASVAAGFEGLIAKRDEGRYDAGKRSRSWLKRKALQQGTFVVAGYTAGKGTRSDTFGGLILGERVGNTLEYRGRVGSGFSDSELEVLMPRLLVLETRSSPFPGPTPDDREAHWIRPGIDVAVEYVEKTSAGVLRLPVFIGFASDPGSRPGGPQHAFEPKTIPDEVAILLDQLRGARKRLTLEGDGWSLPITNLDKELWPATPATAPVTKRDLLEYALNASGFILPHLRGRPLTLLRFPDGITGKRFYQRHWDQPRPAFVESVAVYTEGEDRDRDWLLCNNLPTLLWLCQVADIEWHASLARTAGGADARGLPLTFSGSVEAVDASTLNHPDFLLFDLDPYIYSGSERRGEEPQPNRDAFARACDVAFALRELLDSLGIRSFVKTSGATGVHVYVPIVRNMDYDMVRAFATTVGQEIAGRRPRDVTLEWATEKRTGKVFFDANQNARHKCLAAPFSPRAKPGAPVSLPVIWDELGRVHPGDTSLLDPRWLDATDPWQGILDAKQDLKKLLGL